MISRSRAASRTSVTSVSAYAVAAFVAVALVGCASDGREIDVLNPVEPLVIRVRAGEATSSWLIDAGGVTLFSQAVAIEGRVELLDPVTCVVYDAEALPGRSSTILIAPVDPGRFELIVADGGTKVPPEPPDFTGC